MKIYDKILAKQEDLRNASAVTIAFLGNSVTQGCFDLYLEKDNGIEPSSIRMMPTTEISRSFSVCFTQPCHLT